MQLAENVLQNAICFSKRVIRCSVDQTEPIVPLLLVCLLLIMPASVHAGSGNVIGLTSSAKARPAPPHATPQAVVKKLYADHFAHDMGFTVKTVARKRNWLMPDLYRQIDAYFHRPSSPDKAPSINGDPFTDTQEYPTTFSVGVATTEAHNATVSVIMTFGADKRTVRVLLGRHASGWLVDDLVYEDGTTFRALLKEHP